MCVGGLRGSCLTFDDLFCLANQTRCSGQYADNLSRDHGESHRRSSDFQDGQAKRWRHKSFTLPEEVYS